MTLSYSLADQSFSRTRSVGIFNVARGLLEELARTSRISRLTVFANRTLPPLEAAGGELRVLEVNGAVDSRWGRLAWDNWQLYAAAKKARNEWLFLPKGFGSCLRPCPVRLAVYLHDIIPVIYATRYPGHGSRLKQAYFERVYARTLRYASVIFTNTAFTKAELQGWADGRGLRCPKIIVAGVGFERRPLASVRANHLLLFARPDPHKRSAMAIAMLDRWLRSSGYPGPVYCLGDLPAGRALPSGDARWRLLGRVPQARLEALMASARAVIHSSEYEGLGMPPIEAALAGAVPVYSNVPASIEAMGSVGHAFVNDDYASFSRAMEAAVETGPETCDAWAESLAARHRWSAVGERILEGLGA